ncbi:hypothetical protein B7R77_16420 [Ralstonia solanacearum K60]|uniref:Uncharacterized protein n=1 Tax=Ralstonia solanacearum K60 TaxID=1091042 RepID=A0AAP7ZQ31_RALSL|nr:hypothetical protein B7R77_16420 [Ralstonia solanacearum K60]
MLAVGFSASLVSSVFARSAFVTPRVSQIHAFQFLLCPAVRLSLHLPPPQIARVNADSLWLATPSHASNQPSTLRPQGFADLCITRCPKLHDTVRVQAETNYPKPIGLYTTVRACARP